MVDPVVQRQRWYEESSSLNTYAICDLCNSKFSNKPNLSKHLRVCGYQDKLKCVWCKISFTNRGNLAAHMKSLHGNSKLDSSILKPVMQIKGIKCDGCDTIYKDRWKLNFHIRREHYNLTAKTPCCELKKVNQIWFEKVLNTNIVMEMKKTSPNVLVMRKLGPNTAIKVYNEADNNVRDLSHLYPTSATKNVGKGQCHFCNKIVNSRNLQKHIDEKHRKIAKHQCNNCFRTFKRHYIYIRHVCFKERKRRTQPHLNADTIVNNSTSVNSKPQKKQDLRSRLLRNNLPFKSKH